MERDWRMVVRNLPVHSLLYRSKFFVHVDTFYDSLFGESDR